MSWIYKKLIGAIDPLVPRRMQPLWHHPAGPKTVFFWGPLCKWGLVLAGIADMKRPDDEVSISQSGALLFTGLVWTRWSTVITPLNWSLFSVNVFLVITQGYQLFRALRCKYIE